jgi:DNA-binding LytR/AlgR family response regulator
MTPLKCCVIDDEPLACQLIASYVEKTPFLTLAGSFNSAQDAVKTILNENIDLVFLDIQMPQLNGMEFAKIIPDTCRIIFTTAYSNYAVEGFKVNALDYLLKPISYDEFLIAANKALKWAEQRRGLGTDSSLASHIIVKSEYRLVQIPIDEIRFIEGLKDYVKIYTDSDDRSIMTLMSMKALEKALPSDKFMRVHRSFIVNTTKIRTIERNRIIFGKHFIPISDTYKQAFIDYISAHSIVSSVKDED